METAGSPTKPGLFSTLVAHEMARTSNANLLEPSLGLRPRLASPFETFEANSGNQAPEELIENSAEESAHGANDTEPRGKIDYQQSNIDPSQINNPLNKIHTLSNAQSIEPLIKWDSRLVHDLKPEEHEYATQVVGTVRPDTPPSKNQDTAYSEIKPAKSADNSFILPKESTKVESKISLQPERIINERINAVERKEIIHEIKPLGLFEQRKDQNVGVKPLQKSTETLNITHLSPTQPLIQQAEKSPEPIIEIHIGRIEVRAQVQASPSKPEKTTVPATSNAGLQAYLQGRSKGARS